MVIWHRNEALPRAEMKRLQLARLQETLNRVYARVPYYREQFDQHGVTPGDLKDLSDLSRFPFTTKAALRDNYPYGLFAEPLTRIVRLHASSGTTGKPIVVGYTKKDMETWTGCVARIVTQAGVRRNDVAQICFGYGLFTGGFGLHYGLERVGATVVPASSGNSEKQIMLMQDFGTTVMISTPSYALYLAEVAQSMGVDPRSLPVRLGLFGGEPWSEEMRDEIERRWGMKATDNYGLSEVIGPGVAGECTCGAGQHINEDHFLPEIIDPETGEVLTEPGARGELVFTSLTKEAFPIVRYRTRDITSLNYTPCSCGRTTVRMAKVTGRSDDMLIIRGVNVFPSQIESVLMTIPGLGPHYQIIVDRQGFLDEIEVQVELAEQGFSDNYRELAALEERLRHKLQSVLSLTAHVKLVGHNTLERFAGKAKRVIDRRPKL